MFNTPRWHRFLTVPAMVVALTVLLTSRFWLYALAVCPLALALPFQLRGAWRGDPEAVGTALTATRAVGYLGLAWGFLVLFVYPPGGVIVMAAMGGLLALAGATARESRLAAAMILEGVLVALAGIPLVWLGERYLLLVPAGVLLCAGAVLWLAEAVCHPLPVETGCDLPVAIAR